MITALVEYLFLPAWAVGVGLLLASCAAGCALWRRWEKRWSFLYMLPQQFLLYVNALGAINAISLGQYGDGVVRPGLFIAADQSPIVLVAVLHTLAVLDISGVFLRRKLP